MARATASQADFASQVFRPEYRLSRRCETSAWPDPAQARQGEFGVHAVPGLARSKLWQV